MSPKRANVESSTHVLTEEVRASNIASCIAGWSSLVARRAHNPEVVGSNPAPATRFLTGPAGPVFVSESWEATITLGNKLGIADPIKLAHEEERISKTAALAMYGDGTLDDVALLARGLDASYAYEGYGAVGPDPW